LGKVFCKKTKGGSWKGFGIAIRGKDRRFIYKKGKQESKNKRIQKVSALFSEGLSLHKKKLHPGVKDNGNTSGVTCAES